uniref:Uncharacterized protein n=1 Tax=Aegilops tauschii subsp. strangulata TaxID=200361 RepID=A0A453LWA7_AEGTS
HPSPRGMSGCPQTSLINLFRLLLIRGLYTPFLNANFLLLLLKFVSNANLCTSGRFLEPVSLQVND